MDENDDNSSALTTLLLEPIVSNNASKTCQWYEWNQWNPTDLECKSVYENQVRERFSQDKDCKNRRQTEIRQCDKNLHKSTFSFALIFAACLFLMSFVVCMSGVSVSLIRIRHIDQLMKKEDELKANKLMNKKIAQIQNSEPYF